MAGKTAILSVRIVSDSKGGVNGLLKTAAAVRVLEKAYASNGRTLRTMTSGLAKVAVAGTAITTLAAGALAGTSNVLALGGAIVSTGGAALALPGLFAGAAVGVGVLAMAMKDAGTVLGDLGPAWSNLQDTVSNNYWAKAAQPIRELSQQVLPDLQKGLNRTATIMGNGMAAAARALGGALKGNLTDMMTDINAGFRNMNRGVKPFVQAMVELTRVGTTYMPAVGRSIANVSKAFNAWVQTSSKSGDLNRWIETGTQALRDLGRVAAGAVGVLGAFSRAASAAGGAGLGALADGLARVSEALNGPIWQGALTTVFEGAHRAMQNLVPGVQALGDAFISLAPTLYSIMDLASQAASSLLEGLATALMDPAFQGGAVAGFEGIRDGIAGLQPAFGELGPVVGSLLTTFGELAREILPVLGQLFIDLAPAIVAVSEALAPVVVAFVEDLAPVLEKVIPPLTDLAVRVLPLVSEALVTLSPVLVGFAAVWAFNWVAMSTVATINAVRMAAAWFIAMGPIGWVAGAVIFIAALIIMNWDEIIAKSEELAVKVSASVLTAFVQLRNGLIPIVSGIVSTVVTAFETMRSRIVGIMAGVASTVITAMSTLRSTVGGAIAGVVSTVVSGMSQFRSSVAGGVAGVVSTMYTLPGRIVAAVSGVGAMLFSVGINMMRGLMNGIMAMAGNVAAAARGVVSRAVSAAKSALGIRSPSRVFKQIGRYTGQGMVLGLQSQADAVRKATRGLLDIPKAEALRYSPEVNVSGSSRLAYQGGGGRSTTVVNHNTFKVEGQVVDRLGTAEAIEQLLRERNRMMGATV